MATTHEVFKALVIPVIDQFRPELMLISAGFDAHERDPLARMRLSTQGYAVPDEDRCATLPTRIAMAVSSPSPRAATI